MSGNYSVNVPKLKGRESYDDWAFAAENFMSLEGVDVTSTTGLTEAENKKARAKLIMTIDPSLFVHIKTKATVQNDSGFTRKITLLRNLISIRLESCDSMSSYVDQLVETAQRLKGTGFEINDKWIGSLLLAGLPERFRPMIMAIEHSGLKISADAIKTKLLDMSSDFEVKQEGALIAHGQRRHLQVQVQTNNGSSKNETQPSPVSGNVNHKKQIRCYHCKKIGHFKSQCRLLNKDKQKSTSNVLSAVFLTREFNQDKWYVDSGDSAHMVSNKNMLTNISYESKVKEIIVANRTKVPVLCSGDLRLTTRVKTVTHEVVMCEVVNVLCIVTLTTNLLSVSQMIANGNRVSFNRDGCYIYNSKNVCVGEASLESELKVYRLNIVKSQQVLAAAAQTSCNTWHRRLGGVWSLKNLSISVPRAVLSGEGQSAVLRCSYDLEGAALYSIRWYRAETEFYRFVPREMPPTMVFPLPGASVDLTQSDHQQVRIVNMNRRLSGDYQCEVSADAPLFHTDIRSAPLTVVDPPFRAPHLTISRGSYARGDVLRANCSVDEAYPAPNITWILDDHKIAETVTWQAVDLDFKERGAFSKIEISILEAEPYKMGLTYTSSNLKRAYPDHYVYDKVDKEDKETLRYTFIPPPNGQFSLSCIATIYDIYARKSEPVYIKEDTPHPASVTGEDSSGTSPKSCYLITASCIITALLSL